MEKVVVIIPTYDEVENIGPLINVLQKVFKEVPEKWDMHILVVDDSSPDGTADAVRKKMKRYKNVHLFMNKEKIGLGGAYMKGMTHAIEKLKADVIFEFDADFQHDPALIPTFLEKIDKGADLVLGSRYMKGGSIPKYWGIKRKILSKGGNLFTRLMMLDKDIHDWTTGYRALRPSIFLKVKSKITELRTYSFQISFLYHAKKAGAKIAEVPLNFRQRRKGVSKLPGVEGTIKTFWFVVKSRAIDFLHSRFLKFGVVGFVGYLVNAISLEIFSGTAVTISLASFFTSFKGTFLAFIAQPAAWAAAFAAELAIINNFTFNNVWTFKEAKITKPLLLARKFLEFNLTSFGAVVIQFIIIGTMVLLLGDTRLIRQIGILAAMPLVLSFNYVMYNLVIWKTWKLPWAKKK